MRTVALVGLVLTLSSCVSIPRETTLEWSTIGTGCYEKGLSDVLLLPDEFGHEVSLTDIRVGRLPDTGQGPGRLAHFRRHLEGPFGQSTGEPELFLAVGDWKSSCSVLVKMESCPAASEIYEALSSTSIPVGFAFEHPQSLTVMHGTKYFLSVRDGHGNQTNWSYYGLEHPLQQMVSDALNRLESCAAPAVSAFHRQRF